MNVRYPRYDGGTVKKLLCFYLSFAFKRVKKKRLFTARAERQIIWARGY